MKGFNFTDDVMKLYFKDEEKEKIKKTKILIIGCGGLGSNIAIILTRVGHDNIIIVDYDKVEMKNLNRQQFFYNEVGKSKVHSIKERLLMINPDIKITAIEKKLTRKLLEKIIKKHKPDIIVEAVDKIKSKAMIFETALSMKKIVITASGVAGFGDIENVKIIRKKDYTIIGDLSSRCGCCDECYRGKKECDLKKTLIKKGKIHMPLAPKVSMIASMQADEVLRRTINNETKI